MKVTCHKCGYTWESESKMRTVTCPSCQYKTPVLKVGDKEDDKK